MTKNDVFVADCGGNVVISNHSFETKKGQRYFSNNGNSPMGFSFSGALGAYYGDQSRNVICVTGDGGMNMNIQELQTIKNYNIKTKTIVLNNHIYGITKAYQKTILVEEWKHVVQLVTNHLIFKIAKAME